MKVKGKFLHLLAPGLKKLFYDSYLRTGISDVQLGVPSKVNLRDKPNALDEWPPPKPKKWWKK